MTERRGKSQRMTLDTRASWGGREEPELSVMDHIRIILGDKFDEISRFMFR
jgi:hypothetical protein